MNELMVGKRPEDKDQVIGKGRPRIGVYVCHCGINIAASVDVSTVTKYAASLPGVQVARDYLYMCSEPGQDLIRQDIQAGLINRVVVASCTPRMHEPTFRETCLGQGLNPYYFEQANIREQCAWVNPPGDTATEKAKDLVRAAVGKVAFHEALETRSVEVRGSGLVIGGGIAGLNAALAIAEAGFPVTLVEKTSCLGGQAAGWFRTFPTLNPLEEALDLLIKRVGNHPNISVLLDTTIRKVEGYIGHFEITVENREGQVMIPAGTVVVAVGFEPFDPQLKPELGYGRYAGVKTTVDMERILHTSPEELEGVRDVVFVSCVGSRDKQVGNPYCSRVCCMINMKQAYLLREQFPDARITVFYIDVRAYGKGFEEFYDRVRAERIRYRRGNVSEITSSGDRLLVRAEDTLLGKPVECEADLVVLGVGMVPRPDHLQISNLFKLPRGEDGFFLELHPKLGPVNTAVEGVYLAGACQSPKDITETVAHAQAAAASALVPMLRQTIEVEAAISNVIPEICAGCGICAANCPYGALAVNPRAGAVRVNPTLCKGCGACANICPSNAIKVQHYKPEQILAQIDGLLFPA